MSAQRGFAPVLILIIVSVLLVGGYLVHKNQVSLPYPQITNNKPSKPQAAANLYIDSVNGLQFEIPKGMEAKKDSEEDYSKRNGGDSRKNFTGYVQYEPGKVLGAVSVVNPGGLSESSLFSVWVFDNSEQLDSMAWFNKFWYYPFLWGQFNPPEKEPLAPKNEATVSGQMAKYGIVSYQSGSPKYYYLKAKDRMILIRVLKSPGNLGEQILQTLKIN